MDPNAQAPSQCESLGLVLKLSTHSRQGAEVASRSLAGPPRHYTRISLRHGLGIHCRQKSTNPRAGACKGLVGMMVKQMAGACKGLVGMMVKQMVGASKRLAGIRQIGQRALLRQHSKTPTSQLRLPLSSLYW